MNKKLLHNMLNALIAEDATTAKKHLSRILQQKSQKILNEYDDWNAEDEDSYTFNFVVGEHKIKIDAVLNREANTRWNGNDGWNDPSYDELVEVGDVLEVIKTSLYIDGVNVAEDDDMLFSDIKDIEACAKGNIPEELVTDIVEIMYTNGQEYDENDQPIPVKHPYNLFGDEKFVQELVHQFCIKMNTMYKGRV